MDHRSGMTRILIEKSGLNDEKSSQHCHLWAPASSFHCLCKNGKKHDSVLSNKNGKIPAPFITTKSLDKNFSPKKTGIAQVRLIEEESKLKTIFPPEYIFCNSVVNDTTYLQHSDASNELIECMCEDSMDIKPAPFWKSITTSIEDASLRETTIMMPASSNSNENIILLDEVPWASPVGSFDGSVVMEIEYPPTTLDSMTSTLISQGQELEGSSLELEVTPQKATSFAAGKPKNQARNSSKTCRILKQQATDSSITSALASSFKYATSMKPKEEKKVNGLKAVDRHKKELLILRSSMPVKSSLLGKVKTKKNDDAIVEPSIANESRTTKSAKPKQGINHKFSYPQCGISDKESITVTPTLIKKKTLSQSKNIELSSPKPILPLKAKSSVVKFTSHMLDSGRITGQSSQEGRKTSRTDCVSLLQGEKVLKQFAASQPAKSTVDYHPGLNNSKLRFAKNQMVAGKVDDTKEKTLNIAEQKPVRIEQNSAKQKHIMLSCQQSSRIVPSQSSSSSSNFVSSSYKEENYKSFQSKLSNAIQSRKTHNGVGEGRTTAHVSEWKLVGAVGLTSAAEKSTNLRSKPASSTMSPQSTLSSYVSSSYEEVSDESMLTSDASGSKKAEIFVGKAGVPIVSRNICYQKMQKRISSASKENKSLSLDIMSFRKGKEASPWREHPGQSRLKVMQAEVVPEIKNLDSETGAKSFNESTGSIASGLNTISHRDSLKVVPKHIDLHEKNAQAMINVVIEETAARMNKVKSLISVFESVSSLQE